MKVLLVALLSLAATFASATSLEQPKNNPRASAFTEDGKLYFTLLGDTCNSLIGGLEVDAFCKNDRLTRNYAPVCDASVSIMSTRMGCAPGVEPRVLVMDLNEKNVAREAKVLNLRYGNDVISVQVNR